MAAVEASDANTSAAFEPQNSPPQRCEENGEASASAKFKLMSDSLGQNCDSSEDEEAEKERQVKFKKYEVEYAQYLKAKYFSNKTYTGENVYEEEIKIENETIRSSRFPFVSAFANPAKYLREKDDQMEGASSVLTPETSSPSPPTKKISS